MTRLVRSLSLALPLLLAACANGDFDRLRPELAHDDIHDWVGADAARSAGRRPSDYPLTDNERRLRDLAYPLIEPPYDRNQWYSVLGEYGFEHLLHRDRPRFDQAAYYQNLKERCARSQASLYATLKDDIRNDVERIPAFADTARRVVDIDIKRGKSLAYVDGLTPSERKNALARNAENALVVAWVQRSLAERVASYRYALERLVISLPSTEAVEVEQSLTLLVQQIAQYAVVVEPLRAIGPVVSK